MGQNVMNTAKSIEDITEVVDLRAIPGSGSLATVGMSDVAIAQGSSYMLTGTYTGLLAGASLYMAMDASAIPAFHFHDFTVNAIGSPVLVEFYEDPTVTVNGTQVTGVNQNRKPPVSTPGALTYIGSTVTDDGTLLGSGTILGITTQKNAIGRAELGSGWVLDPTKLYIFKFTNNDNQTIDLHFNFQWHEHEV